MCLTQQFDQCAWIVNFALQVESFEKDCISGRCQRYSMLFPVEVKDLNMIPLAPKQISKIFWTFSDPVQMRLDSSFARHWPASYKANHRIAKKNLPIHPTRDSRDMAIPNGWQKRYVSEQVTMS